MKTWFNESDRNEALARLNRLTHDRQPRWGRLTARQVVCHLADPLRVALREKPVKELAGPLKIPGIAQAVVWILPWPKGAPTAPGFLPGTGMTAPTEFDHDKRVLIDLLERFAGVKAGSEVPRNPVFGRIGRGGWGRLMWRHIDHHLRQFGL